MISLNIYKEQMDSRNKSCDSVETQLDPNSRNLDNSQVPLTADFRPLQKIKPRLTSRKLMNKSAESDAMLMMPDQQDYLVAKIHKTLTRHDDPTLEE